MAATDPPKIEFPCDYTLRIIGDNAVDFQSMVIAVVRVHAPDADESTASLRESRNGNYHSVALTIRATGEPQLAAIFEDLKATGRVQMVL